MRKYVAWFIAAAIGGRIGWFDVSNSPPHVILGICSGMPTQSGAPTVPCIPVPAQVVGTDLGTVLTASWATH